MQPQRFAKGSGRYACRLCGHVTRATGRGDNEHTRLCTWCYNLEGLENAMQATGETPALRAQADAMRHRAVARARHNALPTQRTRTP